VINSNREWGGSYEELKESFQNYHFINPKTLEFHSTKDLTQKYRWVALGYQELSTLEMAAAKRFLMLAL
jgi:hypothetical protein